MLKYNDDSIFVGYIKQLLHSFNLPQCHIGYSDYFKQQQKSLHYIKNNVLYYYDNSKSNVNNYKGDRVRNYRFNSNLKNITKNLEIRNNLYDSYTHEYLGDYLRYIRDYTGLNLMSMYNCFSNVSLEASHNNVNNSEFKSDSSQYTVFVVPVRFNQKYTIAIDWHGTIEMFVDFYSNNKTIESTVCRNLSNTTYQKVTNMRFNHPILFDKLMNKSITPDYSKEKCLKLFIKVPIECKSSIVILEGDYIKDTEMYFNEKHEQVLGHKQFLYKPVIDDELISSVIYDSNTVSEEYEYITKHQLLFINSRTHFLVADRLIEYLCNNVIDSNEKITDNIKQLQLKIINDRQFINNKDKISLKVENLGFWNNSIREFIYRFIQQKGLNNKYFDLLGYVDKDIEFKLGNFDEFVRYYAKDENDVIVKYFYNKKDAEKFIENNSSKNYKLYKTDYELLHSEDNDVWQPTI